MLSKTYGNQHMVSICGGTISVTYVLDIIEVVIRIVNESVFLVDLTSPPASHTFFFTLVNHSDTHRFVLYYRARIPTATHCRVESPRYCYSIVSYIPSYGLEFVNRRPLLTNRRTFFQIGEQ